MTYEYIHIDDDSVVVETPVFDTGNGDIIGYKRQIVMTKEIFTECYEKWILNNNKEDSNA